MKLNHIMGVTLICVTASGCSTNLGKEVNNMRENANVQSAAATEKSLKDAKSVSTAPASVHVNTPWIGNKRIVLNKTPLPSLFHDNYTFPPMQQADLSTIGSWLTRVTGMTVRIAPDALKQPNSTSTTQQGIPGQNAPGGIPQQPIMPVQQGIVGNLPNSSANSYPIKIDVSWPNGELSAFLNLITSRMGISWEYRENEILFYRYMTKTLRLNAIPGQFTTKGSIGKSSSAASGGGSGQGGSFNSNATADTTAIIDVWAAIKEELNIVMTMDGKLSVNMATGTIIIRDTPDVVSRVTEIVAAENRKMSAQVHLSIDILSVTDAEAQGWSIEPSAIYTRLRGAFPGMTMNMVAANQAVLGTSGVANLKINDPLSPWNGSGMIARAIATTGKNVTVVHRDGVTMHNLPTTIAATAQTGLLSSTTPGTAGAAGGTSQAGLNTTTIVTGLLFNMTPVITDSGKILLRGSVDISTKPTIRSVTSGGQTVEVADYTGSQAMMNAAIKNGETLMLSGLSQSGGQLDKGGETLVSALFGKSELARKSLDNMVILVTPYIIEGAEE
ncbi:MAG: hypothetical protein WC742_12700 [Gallionellaceae bacterium]|jgi:type IVB pilus formation R64 PilN family outer membrane protein